MDSVHVTEIVDAEAKKGYSEKTKKDWSMSRVGLSNGESAFVFNPIEIGSVVELKEVNGYRNWVKVKTDEKHDEIMKGLRSVYVKLSAIETRLARLEGETEQTTVKAAAAQPAAPSEAEPEAPSEAEGKPWDKWKKGETPPDDVQTLNSAQVSGAEEVNLDDIPF